MTASRGTRPTEGAPSPFCECGNGLPVVGIASITVRTTGDHRSHGYLTSEIRLCAACMVWERYNQNQLTWREAEEEAARVEAEQRELEAAA